MWELSLHQDAGCGGGDGAAWSFGFKGEVGPPDEAELQESHREEGGLAANTKAADEDLASHTHPFICFDNAKE